MRKVSKVITAAFYSNEAKKVANTTTDGKAIYLHGNKIAEKRNGQIWITSAGWNTNTTKERLNSLSGVSIYQKNGDWFLNGEKWSGGWVSVG